MSKETRQEYIGDGLYASMHNGMIKLQTDRGIIYLEKQVWENLVRFVAVLQPGELQ